jgi:hypothetical protein
MDLLPLSYRLALPALGAQRDDPDPVVHLHYFVPDAAWSYYVTEGGMINETYTFFGFLLASEREQDWSWRRIPLRDLETMLRPGTAVVRDERFEPGRITDVVVLPYQD